MEPIVARLQEFMEAEKLNPSQLSSVLGYDKPEKLYRLFRKEGAMPSVEILQDISNKFEKLDIGWLLTGKRSNTPTVSHTNDEDVAYYKQVATSNKGGSVTPTVTASVTAKGKKIDFSPRVITVDSRGSENIVYVPVRARMGYLAGYGDPEYIGKLEAYRIPGLTNATYRMFEGEGMSMAPTILPYDKVIGEFVPSFDDIRENRVHIMVTRTDGIVIKRVLNRISQRGKIVLKSDTIDHRTEYPTTEIEPENIIEMWYAKLRLTADFSEPSKIYQRIDDLEADMSEMRQLYAALAANFTGIKGIS